MRERVTVVNPRRACARVTVVSVCLSPSVPALAASASVETSKQRYSRVSLRLFLDFYSWIFEKTFREKVMAWKSQYANELELTGSRFPHFRDQRRAVTTWRTTTWSNVASEASYWCNRRETSEIQARAYTVQRGTRTRMRSIHSLSISVPLCGTCCSMWDIPPRVLHFSALVVLCVCLSVCLCVYLFPL